MGMAFKKLQVSTVPQTIRDAHTVVYVDGAWDLFSAGHVAFLREARKRGDFLLVGVHSDMTVSAVKGEGYPISSMEDRALCLLSCSYVSDVLLGSPWTLTRDMIVALGIKVVL